MKKTLFTVILVCSLSGCEEDKSIDAWIEKSPGRVKVLESMVGVSRLERSDYEISRNFAKGLVDVAVEIKQRPELKSRVSARFSKMGSKRICEELILSAVAYRSLLSLCQRKEFFLCAEEVKVIPEATQTILRALSSDQIQQLKKEPICKNKLGI